MKCLRMFLPALLALALTAAAGAQESSLRLNSDPGDFIGLGQNLFLTPADGPFVAFAFNHGSVEAGVVGWDLLFRAPAGEDFTVGTYTGAQRFFGPGIPGMDINGQGRGCNMVTGSFTVLEISFDALDELSSLDITFEQHCEGGTAALRGEIRFNAHPVVILSAPSNLTVVQGQSVNFTVTATDAAARHVVLTATGVPAGAIFTDNGNNTGTLNWTPASSQTGSFLVTFLGDNQAGNVGLASTQISVILPPPPNDDFDHPTVIPSMPFTVGQSATNATVAPDDPFCVVRNQTVWFAFTPTQNQRLEANTFGSDYDTTLSVYTGTRGALTQIGCNDDSNGTLQSRVRFDAVAGTTYYFEVSSFFPVSSADLTFNLLLAPPPLSIAPVVTQFGSVGPSTGTASIFGFVTCTQPAFVTISGQLKQTHGNVPVTGFFSAFVPCNGTTPWGANIQTTTTLFHGRAADLFTGGKADVSATASAFDPENGIFIQKNLAVTITLRGKP